MAWYLCTIGKAAPGNWELCKQVGLYGIPGGQRTRRRPRVEVGDHLLVWQGGKGYIAEATVTGEPRIPSNQDEAPWPGGTYRFAYVVPIDVVLEVESPLRLSFDGNEQTGTGLSKGKFQLSFSRITEREATYISTALREWQAAEMVETETKPGGVSH